MLKVTSHEGGRGGGKARAPTRTRWTTCFLSSSSFACSSTIGKSIQRDQRAGLGDAQLLHVVHFIDRLLEVVDEALLVEVVAGVEAGDDLVVHPAADADAVRVVGGGEDQHLEAVQRTGGAVLVLRQLAIPRPRSGLRDQQQVVEEEDVTLMLADLFAAVQVANLIEATVADQAAVGHAQVWGVLADDGYSVDEKGKQKGGNDKEGLEKESKEVLEWRRPLHCKWCGHSFLRRKKAALFFPLNTYSTAP